MQEFWPPPDAEELRFIVETAHYNAPHIVWIGVATVADGRVFAAIQNLLEGMDVTQRPWFIEGTRHNAAVDVHDAVLLQRALNRDPALGMLRLIDFVSPIRDRAGNIVAMIGWHILWDWVVEAIRREEAQSGLRLGLVAASGVPEARLRDAPRFAVRQRGDTPSFGWQIMVVGDA